MFIIALTYIKPIEVVDQYLAQHREFLETYYQKDALIVSGPMNPRNGGIIISQLIDRKELEAILAQDPFFVHQIAEYEITEFMPVKFHKDFSHFVSSNSGKP